MVLLIGVVVLVGLLNYVPALALGPIVEAADARRRPLIRAIDDGSHMTSTQTSFSLFDRALVGPAVADAFRKLDRACSGATR